MTRGSGGRGRWLPWVVALSVGAVVFGGVAVLSDPAPDEVSLADDEAQRGDEAGPGVENADGASPRPPGALPESVVAPSGAAARELASSLGVPVEDVAQRTPSSQVLALPDGQWQGRVFAGDVFALVTGDGSRESDWAMVDPTLEFAEDGRVRPRAYGSDLWLSAGGADGADGGVQVVFSRQVGDSGVVVEALWDGALPPVELDGARAVYREVLPGVDYVVDVMAAGVEQYFVVRDREALPAEGLGWDLRVRGGSLRPADDGGLDVLDGGGAVVSHVPTAFAWDAPNDALRGRPVLGPWRELPEGGNALPEQSRVELELSGSLARYRVALGVDEAWLADPETVFPVVVDPSTELDGTMDTYINSGSPGSSYASDTELLLGTYNGGSNRFRVFVRFPTAAFQNKDITDADFKIYNHHSWSCSSRAWQVWETGTLSSSVTWNSQPKSSNLMYEGRYTQTKGYSSSCSDGWISADIDPIPRKWALLPSQNRTIMLSAEDEGDNFAWKRFYSINTSASYTPYIAYTYNRAPFAPTTLMLFKGVGDTVGFDLVSGAEIPLELGELDDLILKAAVSDPDGGTVRAVFEILQDGRPAATVRGSDVTSGNVSAVTLPFRLQYGSVYTVRVRTEDARRKSEGVLVGPREVSIELVEPRDVPTSCDAEVGEVSSTSC